MVDITLQIIDHCDPCDQEARENLWIYHLETLPPEGFNQKRPIKK